MWGSDRRILEQLEKLIMLVQVDSTKIDAVKADIDTLVSDTTTALADIKTALGAIVPAVEDPATAAKIQAVMDSVTKLDSQIKAADPGAKLPPTTTP